MKNLGDIHVLPFENYKGIFLKHSLKTHPNGSNYKLSTHKNRNTHFFLHIEASVKKTKRQIMWRNRQKGHQTIYLIHNVWLLI